MTSSSPEEISRMEERRNHNDTEVPSVVYQDPSTYCSNLPSIERLDIEQDESVKLVNGMEVKLSEDTYQHDSRDVHLLSLDIGDGLGAFPSPKTNSSRLGNLPSELLYHIILFLDPIEVSRLCMTCKRLQQHGYSDKIWQKFVHENTPGLIIDIPHPYKSFRELYIAHDPYWFLPKYKIWFSDLSHTGKVIVTRFNPDKGNIEGFQLVARRRPTIVSTWLSATVMIHSFEPRMRLHTEQPIIELEPMAWANKPKGKAIGTSRPSKFNGEVPMKLRKTSAHGLFSTFSLARRIQKHPGMEVWPPSSIPSQQWVRNASHSHFKDVRHQPQVRSDVADKVFRINSWMEMLGRHPSAGIRIGEKVETYATLEPSLYQPTINKPWRGIWVGDYSGHGSEFLLVHQPDDEVPFDESLVVQFDGEALEDFEARKEEERLYRGSLKAVKLTGDPNIPRGETTFVAEDLSLRHRSDEGHFKGAMIVESLGHIAQSMFQDGLDKYIRSQLILISPNKMAQHWVEYGHVSYFERVDLDALITSEAGSWVEMTRED